jgi:Zn-dependent protease with chaperone function
MSIDSEQDFIDLVRKAEHDAEANPRAYTTRLAFFAVLGYLVIFLVLFSLVGLAGGLIATAFVSTSLFILLLKKKLIIAVGAGIWVLLRALWVRFTPPEGYALKRAQFPQLFAELDALSKQLDSLTIHEVILDRNLNASVVQHPRFGILGWHKNYLILGYQLLLTLSPEEMRSVLAHEFGHLSGNHSRFSGWIYRVRISWMRILSAFDEADSWGGRLMRKFFNWYSPQFEAYSFALARNNEYEADAIAAELTSPEIATRALVNVHVTAPYVDQRYWDSYFKYADELEHPPHAPFEGLARFLGDNPMAREEMLESIRKEMQVETHYADTHPSLKDRVNALKATPQLPQTPETSAAQAWLGDLNQKIMQDFDQEWLANNEESWKRRFDYVSKARKGLSEFANTEIADLSDDDLWNYASWTNEFETAEAAMPLFRAYQQRYPEDPDAAYAIGMTLLEQGDASCLDQLRLARKSINLIERAANAGYDFLNKQGRKEEAEAWWQESIEQNKVFVAARAERASVTAKDTFIPPQIEQELLDQLIANLKSQKKVGKVWLAQKQVEYFPESPVYIIAFSDKGFSWSSDSLETRVAQNLDVPGSFFVVCRGGSNKGFAKKVIKVGKRII